MGYIFNFVVISDVLIDSAERSRMIWMHSTGYAFTFMILCRIL
jgi:hypothetical protein